MGKKTSIMAVTILITAAVILGIIFVNKGDGPVTGMILADKGIENVQDYQNMMKSQDAGLYVILEKEFNKFNEKTKVQIKPDKSIYVNIYFVECPKGSKFTAKWTADGKTVKEEIKPLSTNQQGVIAYMFEGNKLRGGNYLFELYSEGKKLFEYNFLVD